MIVFTATGAFGTTPVCLWSRHFGGLDFPVVYSVATDPSGNVVMAGSFEGAVDFGGGYLYSAGNADIFVAKFNAAGIHQWSQSFGDIGDQIAYSVATDASGNVIITGDFSGTVNFGGGNLTSAGSTDIFVAKFNSDGVHQWSKRFGDLAAQHGYSVATDASGSVIITGDFNGTVNFGAFNFTSSGLSDIFVAKYNAAGVYQWS